MSGSIHAVLEQNDGGDIYVSSLLRGGQLAKKVRPLDRLEAIDSQPCSRLPLAAVRRLISGMEGSPVTLTLTRRGMPGSIVTTVVRTASELSDLQVSLLEDVIALVKEERGSSFAGGDDVYESAKRGSWRSPTSYEGALFTEVVDGIKQLKRGLPPQRAPLEGLVLSDTARAAKELEAAQRAADNLRREMMDKDKADVAAVTITIKGSKGALADKAAKQALQTSIQNDAAKALGVMSRRLEVVGMHRADPQGQLSGGDYDFDLFVLPCPVDAPPTAAPACRIAEELVFQANTSGSPLRQMGIGAMVTRGEHRSTYEYVHRLRHTVRMLQEEVANIEGNAERIAQRESVIHQLEYSLNEARREISRLEVEVRELTSAIANSPKNIPPADDSRLKAKLFEVENLLDEAQNVIVRMQSEKRQNDAELARLRDVLDSTATQRQGVEQELGRLRALVRASEGGGGDGRRVRELEDELAKMRQDVEASIRENQQLLSRLRIAEGTDSTHVASLREAHARAEKAEADLRALKALYDDADRKLLSAPVVAQQLEGENRRLAQALAAAQEAKVAQDQEIARYKDTVTAQTQQVAVLMRECDRLRLEKGNSAVLRTGAVTGPAARPGVADEDVRIALRNAKAELDRLRAELLDLRSRLGQAEGDKRAAEAVKAAEKELLDQQKHIAAQAIKDHKEIACKFDQLSQQARDLETKNSVLDAKAKEYDVTRQTLQAELQKLRAEKDSQIAQLQEDIKAQKLYIAQLQVTFEQVQTDAQAHRGEAQRMRQLVDGIEAEKKMLRDEIRDHRERLDKYSELHSLDLRQKSQKDDVIAAKDREIDRLRVAFKTASGPAAPPVVPPPSSRTTYGGVTVNNPISSLLKSHT